MSETTAKKRQPRRPGARRTQKFRSRQAAIVRAAASLINYKGVRGMTLADVAARLGIVPTGVIYYFASKEALAAACFRESIDVYEALISDAQAGSTPQQRLRLFVQGYIALARDIARGRREPLTVLNDLRALNDPAPSEAFVEMFRHARALLVDTMPRGAERQALNAVTHLVLSQLFWSVVWLPLYDPRDYDRVASRMLDILERGLGVQTIDWDDPVVAPIDADASGKDASREMFLRAATQIINEHGYLGASVDKVSARLNVTKGSFYYHNEAKDDLVVACFQRALDVMRRAQNLTVLSAKDGWGQISAAVVALVDCQVSERIPLLRTSALTSAPEAMQSWLIGEFGRVSLNFSSIISDGVADGSVRAVDAHIAGQMVTAMINAAATLRNWTPDLPPALATKAYARGLLTGVDSALSLN